jgi:hypothetical protein
MKTLSLALLFVFSLAANAVMLTRFASPGTYVSHRSFLPFGVSPGSAAARGNGSPAGAAAKPSEVTVAWDALQGTGDLKALVARLRAAGFPASVVRAIAAAQLSEQYAARRKEIQAGIPTPPYWKGNTLTSLYGDPKRMAAQAALRDLYREQSKAMKDLLGPDADSQDPLTTFYQHRQYGNLASDKVDQLSLINQDYNDLSLQVRAAMQGITLSGDREKLAFLNKEKDNDIKALLTPEEYDDYQLRSSSTASSLRYQLSAFNPTEEEFRTIFKLQQAFDDQYSYNSGGFTPDLARQRADAQKQLTEQVTAALDPDRAADYARSIDNNYQAAARIVDRLDLPKETATQVWTLQKDIEQRANAVRMDRTLTPDVRNLQMAQLADEATTKISAALGQQGLEVYKQNGGFWLQNLQPRPGPTGPVIIGNGTVIIKQ